MLLIFGYFIRTGEAKRLVQLSKGLTSVSFGGKNPKGGDDFYVTAASQYLNFENGRFEGPLQGRATLYKISNVGSGQDFDRLDVR